MRAFGMLLVLGGAAAASGCVSASVNLSETGTNITTVPAGARVFMNGTEVCATTPCSWNEGDGLAHRYHVQVRKEGFREVDLYLDKEMSFFSAFFSVVTWRMPRQVAFTLEPAQPGSDPAHPPSL
jgi:PEGA domain-containing protein